MAQITLDIPEDALLGALTSPEAFGREMRLAAALFWFERGEVSQEKAARIAGLTRQDFIDAACEAKVEIFQVDAEDLGVRERHD